MHLLLFPLKSCRKLACVPVVPCNLADALNYAHSANPQIAEQILNQRQARLPTANVRGLKMRKSQRNEILIALGKVGQATLLQYLCLDMNQRLTHKDQIGIVTHIQEVAPK